MCGHFNQSGYEEESVGQNVFMGMKCHNHVSKEVEKRKKKHQAHLILFVYFLKPTIEVSVRSQEIPESLIKTMILLLLSSTCLQMGA